MECAEYSTFMDWLNKFAFGIVSGSDFHGERYIFALTPYSLQDYLHLSPVRLALQ